MKTHHQHIPHCNMSFCKKNMLYFSLPFCKKSNFSLITYNLSLKVCLLLITFHLSLFTSFAQTLTIDGAELYIDSAAMLAVEGDISNVGTLNNNGTVALTGNWNNKDTYLANNSTFILYGIADQTMNNAQQTDATLVLQGRGNKTINGDFDLTGKIVLQSGILLIPPSSSLILTDKVEVQGGYDSSYIDGTVYHRGTGRKLYPLGSNGVYRPVVLDSVAGVVPLIGFSIKQPNPNSQNENLHWLMSSRFWEMDVAGGQYDSSLITLSYNPDDFLSDTAGLVVAQANNLNSPYISIGAKNKQGDVSRGRVTSISPAMSKYYTLAAATPIKTILYIPNTFAPVATNDEDKAIRVYGNRLSPDGFSFIVFNTWNNVVFQTNSLDQMQTEGWTGYNSITGAEEQTGTYKYILTAKDVEGKNVRKKGDILLIR